MECGKLHSLAGQSIGRGVEASVDLEDVGRTASCVVGQGLCEILDPPVRQIGDVILVQEVD